MAHPNGREPLAEEDLTNETHYVDYFAYWGTKDAPTLLAHAGGDQLLSTVAFKV